MESTLETIEHLALSSNRVEVLQLLAADRRTRNELAEATGASQATLGRILGDFGERSWIRREGGEYVATATGRLLASGFTDLLTVVETERKLRGIVAYLPTDEMDFDLGHLADATVTAPTGTRPNAPVQRVVDLLREADDVRVFSHAFNERSLTTIQERVSGGDRTFRGVFSGDAIDALAEDSELRRRLERLLESPNVELRIHEDGVPLAVTIADDAVHVLVRDENGVLRASVDTDDPTVRSWARDAFERYWESASAIHAEELSR